MSNTVRLAMTVRGSEADVRAFIDAFRQGFHGVVPLPPEDCGDVVAPRDWEHVRIDTWGVKRSPLGMSPMHTHFGFTEEPRATFGFDTDWRVPRPFFAKASVAWPSLRFMISWAEEDREGGRSVWLEGREFPTSVKSPSMAEADAIDDGGEQWGRARNFFLDEHLEWARLPAGRP